jgi:enamine deaminase RidA (YjgF/YER057c/UK114 family)
VRSTIEVEGLGHKQPIPLATLVGNLLVTSGLNGKAPGSAAPPADAAAEVEQAFANLDAVLAAAGATREEIAELTFSVRDKAVRELINPVWLRWFPDEDDRPVRHTVTADLPAGLRLQLKCMALLAH